MDKITYHVEMMDDHMWSQVFTGTEQKCRSLMASYARKNEDTGNNHRLVSKINGKMDQILCVYLSAQRLLDPIAIRGDLDLIWDNTP